MTDVHNGCHGGSWVNLDVSKHELLKAYSSQPLLWAEISWFSDLLLSFPHLSGDGGVSAHNENRWINKNVNQDY